MYGSGTQTGSNAIGGDTMRHYVPMKLMAGLALACQLFVPAAHADDYPSHAIRMIVPFAPGGTADIIARPLALKLGEILHQSIVVMNHGGAGGALAAGMVASARNDGYTLLLGSNGALTISQHLGTLPYDPVKDFAPVGMVATSQFILVTHPSVPVKNVQDLIALARAKNGAMTFGSAGVGNVGHLAAELFDSITGVKMVHVPYAGTGPMTVDLLAGRVNLAYPGLSSMVPSIRSGALHALAVTSRRRSPLLPEVPTMEEAGLKNYDAETFWALLVPAGTPKPVIDKLNAAMVQALQTPELRKIYLDNGNEPQPGTPAELAERIHDDIRKWGDIISNAGIEKNP
jgi:tripartite-type tricarboxylate transporter receptor subunit TctC